MSKQLFAFHKGDRLSVPGRPGVQGVVTSRVDYADGENNYRLTYLLANGDPAYGYFGEGAVKAAQKPVRKARRKAKAKTHALRIKGVRPRHLAEKVARLKSAAPKSNPAAKPAIKPTAKPKPAKTFKPKRKS